MPNRIEASKREEELCYVAWGTWPVNRFLVRSSFGKTRQERNFILRGRATEVQVQTGHEASLPPRQSAFSRGRYPAKHSQLPEEEYTGLLDDEVGHYYPWLGSRRATDPPSLGPLLTVFRRSFFLFSTDGGLAEGYVRRYRKLRMLRP